MAALPAGAAVAGPAAAPIATRAMPSASVFRTT
jgi:hypothetical protein